MTNELIAGLASTDAEAIKLRLILALLADSDGVVHVEKNDLAEMLDVTKATLNRRLAAANVTIDSMGRILVGHAPVEATQSCVAYITSIPSSSIVSEERSDAIDDKAIIDRFRSCYEAKYGKRPFIDYRKAGAIAKKFVRTYGDDSLRIIETVFELYDTTWKTAQFPTPSFGAVCGWLAEKVAPVVCKNRRGEEATITRMTDLI